MRKTLLWVAFLGALPAAIFAEVTKDDLKTLIAGGISENVIVAYVISHGPLARLSPQDIIDLKRAGATESLLTAVLTVQGHPAAAQNASPDASATNPPPPSNGNPPPYYSTYSAPAYYGDPGYGYGYPYGYPGWGYPWYGPGLAIGFGFGTGCFGHSCSPGHIHGGHVIVGHSGTVATFHGGHH